MTIARRFNEVKDNVRRAQLHLLPEGRQVTVLAASKGKMTADLQMAIAAGITDFGENRVQEALDKWPLLRAAHPNLRLHLIGPLQRNKVAPALAFFDVIQSLDRISLAETLAHEMAKANRRPDCFIQVNTGKEPQKAGVMPEQAGALIEHCLSTLQLPVVGLMCVPPHGQPPAPHFAWLRELAQRHQLSRLSMGMSEDYETAVRLGGNLYPAGAGVVW